MSSKSTAIDNNSNSNKNKNNNKINFSFKQNKDFSFSNDDENDDPNKDRFTIDEKKNTINSINIKNKIINLDKKIIPFVRIKKYNNVPINNNRDSLNELTINRLEEENNLLKQEIEIVKSNLIISDEKELLHKTTLKHINKINKEKEISLKNTFNLINEYKKREYDIKIKIKEMENEFTKKEDDLNNELSILKKELFKKNKIINDLNQTISELNKQIDNLTVLLSEKTKLIQLLSKKRNENSREINNISNDILNKTTIKSCNNNIHFKKIDISNDIKMQKPEKSLSNLKYLSLNKNSNKIKTNNSLRYIQKMKINDYIFNNESFSNNCNVSNDDNIIRYMKKNTSYKKINSNNNNQNSLKLNPLKKNNSYKNISYNSITTPINKNQNSIYESRSSINTNSINLTQFKRILDKKAIKQLKNNSERNAIKKVPIHSPIPRRNDSKSKNNINNIELNDYFYLMKSEKNIQSKINNDENEKKYKKIDKKACNGQYNNTYINYISKTKLRNEFKKNRIIEINKYYLNNPTLIKNSNSSVRNMSSDNHNNNLKI